MTRETFRGRHALLLTSLLALAGAGCRQDMHDQAKFEPLEASPFYADGAASRVPPEGTVARGQLRADGIYYTGMTAEGDLVARIPIALTPELVARGRERFNAFCSPCHGQLGNGRGMIVRRGFKQPNSFHTARLRTAPDGYFYDTITNGFGQMSSYAPQIEPRDRWAIVAYIRALQLSQGAVLGDLPTEAGEALRERLGGGAGDSMENGG